MQGPLDGAYLIPAVYVTSLGIPDPYTPPDGDWDVVGDLSVTGDVSCATISCSGVVVAGDGDSDGGGFEFAGGGHWYRTGSGSITCHIGAADKLSITAGAGLRGTTGTATDPAYTFLSHSDTGMSAPSGNLTLSMDGSAALTFDASLDATFAGDVLPSAHNTYELGATGTRWLTVYTDAVYTSYVGMGYDGNVAFGNNDARIVYSTDQTPDALFIGVSNVSYNLIVGEVSHYNVDYGHAQQSNPTLWIHSATSPASATDEWLSLTHDQTDPVIDWGSGDLNFAGGSATASTVTHDEYWTVKIGGVTKNIMLGS